MSIYSGMDRDKAAEVLRDIADMIRDDQQYTLANIAHLQPIEWSEGAGVTDHVYLGHSFVLSTRPISFDKERKIREILEG